MNLKTLFNFNYFKENLKKSKGLLAFFFGVVPLLNIVMLVTKEEFLGTFNDISAITIVGLYIVPIVLAISLMGFVFSKKNTDFVLSKPLNRKTIYLTNLLGGVITLGLLILLNTIIFWLMSLIFSNMIIPFNLLIDYFLFWSISYIFMFAVTLLAITIAGNSIGAFVLIFLITCLIPFFRFAKIVFNEFYTIDNYIKCTDNTCKPEVYDCSPLEACETELTNNDYYILQYHETYGNNFTAPLIFLNAHSNTMYNKASMLKMIILSIIYFAIGLFTFKKRKMENNEISFHSELMHYFIKTLGFIIVSFACYVIIKEGGTGSLLIAITGALIYYIVYDLITRRSIFKFRKSLVICFVTFGIFLGIYFLYDTHLNSKSIYLDKIDNISFYHNGEYLTIEDENIINMIIKSSISSDMHYDWRMAIFENNNKYYRLNINFTEDLEQAIHEYLYRRNVRLATTFKYDSINYASDKIEVSKEFKNLVKDAMHYIKLDDLRNASKTISIYNYQNHGYQKLIVPYTLNAELDKYILTTLTNRFINNLNENKDNNIHIDCTLFNDEDLHVFDYVIKNNLTSFINYLKTNNIKTVDNTRCIIYSYSENLNLEIGDANSFYEEFKRYRKNIENNEGYQLILKSYQTNMEKYNNNTYEY